jgi:putative addiction module component (TIGR02574 family)
LFVTLKKDFMPYNKEELLSLPAEEKIALAEELWSSVEDERLPVTDEELTFAEERLRIHNENPAEGMSIEEFKKFFSDKHGL